MVSHIDLRQRFADFWKSKGHVEVPGIPLVPQNDPTTLFTGSGMQQLVPNLLGEPHPLGTRLYNIQDCFRAQDIEEVGDNRHGTFFEMMGNWSLGDYFKKEQLPWVFDLYTNTEYGFGLNPSHLYVTVFGGSGTICKDEESIFLWQEIFTKYGIPTTVGTADSFQNSQHITLYDAKKNWWSRSGTPDQMPVGEVGGPDSELFYDFGEGLHLHEKSQWSDTQCHVNCDCGRFMEIGNSVFIQYLKQQDGTLKELPKKNVDFGGGFERVLAAIHNNPDVFQIDVIQPIVKAIQTHLKDDVSTDKAVHSLRVVTDHIRSATQLAADGIIPGPNEQGYVMRRLIRRAVRAAQSIHIDPQDLALGIVATQEIYGPLFEEIRAPSVKTTIMDEVNKYLSTLENGKKIIEKTIHQKQKLNGTDIFNLYQSIGVPAEEVAEIAREMGAPVDMSGFEEAKKAHIEMSRAGSEQKFKGGLADQSEQVTKYHTATHLLHQALCDILGTQVRQEGSNITGERLRFDFHCDHKPTPEEVVQISSVVNEIIDKSLPVNVVTLPKIEAEKIGAKSFFREKYPDTVKVYFVGNTLEEAYSKEFCGGPHVSNTQEIGHIEIYKVEKIGKDLFRIYGK